MRFTHELAFGAKLGPRSISSHGILAKPIDPCCVFQCWAFVLCYPHSSCLDVQGVLSPTFTEEMGYGLLILSSAILSLWSSYWVELDPRSTSSQLSLYPLISEIELFTYYFCYCFIFWGICFLGEYHLLNRVSVYFSVHLYATSFFLPFCEK